MGVASGTDAVRFALMAAGVQPGDVVITVPHTFIATTEGISQAGARPDFVDIDERTYCMDPAKLQEYLERECYFDRETGKPYHRKWRAPVTAVVPVHLYGQIADMDPILDIGAPLQADRRGRRLPGPRRGIFFGKGESLEESGLDGSGGCFQFLSRQESWARAAKLARPPRTTRKSPRKMRMLRDHGQAKKYYHDVEGYNGRLDSIQAGILSVKLRHLPEWNRKRQRSCASDMTNCSLQSDGVVAPLEPDWSRAVYHLYVIRVAGSRRPAETACRSENRHGNSLSGSAPLCRRPTQISDTKQGISQ